MADGGATYTVNIELATRQFSQDLRNLKNKIKNELGKTVKVATGGTGGGAVAREKAKALREERIEEAKQKKKRYLRDRQDAFAVRHGRAVSANLKLEKFGLDVEARKLKLGEAGRAGLRGDLQFAEAKLKVLNEELDKEFKLLDLINKQAEAEKKALINKENTARKLENRQRKGPHGQRMYGPVDSLGNPIYTCLLYTSDAADE